MFGKTGPVEVFLFPGFGKNSLSFYRPWKIGKNASDRKRNSTQSRRVRRALRVHMMSSVAAFPAHGPQASHLLFVIEFDILNFFRKKRRGYGDFGAYIGCNYVVTMGDLVIRDH